MSECELWSGKVNPGGYPTLGSGKLAHRAAYELSHPDESIVGLEVHHMCGTRSCVNIEHLQALGGTEHRKLHAAKRRKRQTHCVNGHEFTDENTDMVTDAEGYVCRRCRQCRLELQARYRERNRKPRIKKPPKTHCVNGHEYTEENSAYRGGDKSKRYCRECNRKRSRDYQRSLQARAKANNTA